MKVKAILSIGFPGANQQEEEIEIDDEALEGLLEVLEALEGLNDSEKESYILKEVDEWAAQLVETWYEEDEDE